MTTIKTLTVALVGNPNAGKSTLFNALSGLRQRVGNYPGVTVELKKGRLDAGETPVELIDLPGTYSLAARSPDEMVAVDLLLGRRPEEPRPDVVVSVVDATNLDRHLYLTSQLLDLGEPVVVAVNMTDAAAAQGVRIDYEKLSRELGVPVVPIQANKGVGLDVLTRRILTAAGTEPPRGPAFPVEFEKEVAALQPALSDVPGVLVRRLILDVNGYVEQWLVGTQGDGLKARLADARQRLAAAGHPVPAVEARTRFGWVRNAVAAAVTRPAVRPTTWTDRLDRVLTHRVWGTLAFLAVMFLVFQTIFTWAKPLMETIDAGREWAAKGVEGSMDPGPLRALLVDGVVKGVGSVVIFLPQILILFGFIAVLEDCGYMARAAFLMDRLMSRCGLSGKSFIPMLSSVACAIPGIMSTRVIENRRDRLTTILVAPLMSCSARLPVYVLLIAAFLPVKSDENPDGFGWWVPGLTLFAMYLIGFVAAPVVALLLKRTLLRGATPVFVMELPAYKRPTLRAVVRRMVEAGWAFVRRAGTVILAAMVLIWASLYFPHTDAAGVSYEDRVAGAEAKKDAAGEDEEAVAAAEKERNAINGEWKRNSYLGRVGRAMEPAFAPLGWDWRIGTAAMASFPAREVVVGMLGMVYDVGEYTGEDGSALAEVMRKEWAASGAAASYPVPVALSLMVFVALCLQCVSTLAVMRRETGNWWWPAFTFAYMTGLAYVGALVTFQVGRLVVDAMK
ncbi:ferrous iron transport protein B [Urbifossiella limnaea]|nr:ferrous iron transport protein B [Urbifossiella limnaea]